MRSDHDDQRDRRLSELLSDSVSDVEPRDTLRDIRARTKVKGMRRSRPYLLAAGGAALAAAAVTVAVALVGGNLAGDATDAGPAGTTQSDDPTPSDPAPSDPSPTSATEVPPATEFTAPVYYVGDTPQGPRLYREFRRTEGASAEDLATVAADLAVSGTPLDPDYRSGWPDGVRVSEVAYDGDVVTVDLSGATRELPSGVSEAEASAALEQVIYTVQGALQDGRPGVQLLVDGERTPTVLGRPTNEPLANGPVLDTLALVNLTTPEEGTVFSGTLEVDGVANSVEANVPWELRRGETVMAQGFFTAEGSMGEKLFPFSSTVRFPDLAPGEYTFVVMTDDPSGGAEGFGPHVDSRNVTLE